LKSDVDRWIPVEISKDERSRLLDTLIPETISQIDKAIDWGIKDDYTKPETEELPEVPAETDEETPQADALQTTLLDRLLYKGVLPRYAFPTDVATFYVFDRDRSNSYRPEFLFSPSQGLSVALSQYAPGKEVWIAGKKYTSGAIYSPMKKDRYEARLNQSPGTTNCCMTVRCSQVYSIARAHGVHRQGPEIHSLSIRDRLESD